MNNKIFYYYLHVTAMPSSPNAKVTSSIVLGTSALAVAAVDIAEPAGDDGDDRQGDGGGVVRNIGKILLRGHSQPHLLEQKQQASRILKLA